MSGATVEALATTLQAHRVTPEPIGDDLRCTVGLAPKYALIAEQTE
jgi:hypothetical protein